MIILVTGGRQTIECCILHEKTVRNRSSRRSYTPASMHKTPPAAPAALAATTAQTPTTLRSSPKVLRAHAQLCEKRSRGDAPLNGRPRFFLEPRDAATLSPSAGCVCSHDSRVASRPLGGGEHASGAQRIDGPKEEAGYVGYLTATQLVAQPHSHVSGAKDSSTLGGLQQGVLA